MEGSRVDTTKRRLVAEVCIAAVLGIVAVLMLWFYPGVTGAETASNRERPSTVLSWTLWAVFLPGVLPGVLIGLIGTAASAITGGPQAAIVLGAGGIGNALVYGTTWFMVRTGTGRHWSRRTGVLLAWLAWIVIATLVGVLFHFDLGAD